MLVLWPKDYKWTRGQGYHRSTQRKTKKRDLFQDGVLVQKNDRKPRYDTSKHGVIHEAELKINDITRTS